MLPKICSVVTNSIHTSKIIRAAKEKYPFINFVPAADYSYQGEHVLIYGYSLAKSLYDNVSIGDYQISDKIRWTFTEFESLAENYFDEWVEETFKVFFDHTRVVGEYGDALWTQMENVEICFIYCGNHVVYLFDAKNVTSYSWTHEEISYRLDVTPDAFIADIIHWFHERKQAVYAFNATNINSIAHTFDTVIFYVQDMLYSATGQWVTKSAVKQFLHPFTINTPQFLGYLSRVPNAYTDIDTADYMARWNASIADQIYSTAPIFFSRTKLTEKLRESNRTGQQSGTLETIHSTIDSSGYIRVPYLSRNKVTGRMFPHRAKFNPVTENDPNVLECMTSRFKNGTIVCFDFAQFEPTIIGNISGVPIKGDIHQRAADILSIPRERAKKLNNMLLYGGTQQGMVDELNSLELEEQIVERYLSMMLPIVRGVTAYKQDKLDQWMHKGYITNKYGRRVWVKNKNGVFNNAIQSAAADIFNACSILVFDYLETKHSKLFMHRFDSLYVDVHPDETEVIEDIVHIMSNTLGIEFSVSVSAGRNMNSLEVT